MCKNVSVCIGLVQVVMKYILLCDIFNTDEFCTAPPHMGAI